MRVFLAAPFDAPSIVTGLGGDLAGAVRGHLAGSGIRLDGYRFFVALVPDGRVTATASVVSLSVVMPPASTSSCRVGGTARWVNGCDR